VDRRGQLDDWRKYRRQSLWAIPVEVGIAVICGLSLWAIAASFEASMWIVTVIVAPFAWGLIGETINVLYLTARIAFAGNEKAKPER